MLFQNRLGSSLIREFANASKSELLQDVLLVRKTPKYERLKNSKFIEHPYI